MGILDTFPGTTSPAPATAPVVPPKEDKGLPGWAIALIVLVILMVCAGVVMMVLGRSSTPS